jgi:hypothetical protein
MIEARHFMIGYFSHDYISQNGGTKVAVKK